MGKNRYIIIGLGVGALVFLVLGSITALIPNGIFTRMITPKPLDYVFLTLTSALLGAYAGLHFYGKEKSSRREECAFVGGTLSGVFSFSCPVCNAILVYLFGVSAVLTYFEPLRPALGALGVGILSVAVYMKIQKVK